MKQIRSASFAILAGASALLSAVPEVKKKKRPRKGRSTSPCSTCRGAARDQHVFLNFPSLAAQRPGGYLAAQIDVSRARRAERKTRIDFMWGGIAGPARADRRWDRGLLCGSATAPPPNRTDDPAYKWQRVKNLLFDKGLPTAVRSRHGASCHGANGEGIA